MYNMWTEMFARAVNENGVPSIHDHWATKDVSPILLRKCHSLC